MNAVSMKTLSDDQLWQRSCAGDREAFGRIVERYQSLVCSLAYSACGDLTCSEDLAQETFVTAWQKLGELREPGKLRAWLCGIVRNLSANAVRRELRRGGPAESLDGLEDAASPGADPAALAVTQEEAQLLWRSLAGLPESYREPMVLFYRQGQSVAEVAGALELSEEAVKQRLSRGRAMLRDELATVVESTLTRSRPGPAFTMAVLVALPMVSASTASAALAAGAVTGGGASAAGKGVLAKLGLGVFVGPLIGLACAWLSARAAASRARSPEERSVILRYARVIILYCFALSIGLAAVLSQAGKLYTASAPGIVLGICVWTTVLVGGILWLATRLDRRILRVRRATGTTDADLVDAGREVKLPRYVESKLRLLGLPLFAAAWGGHNSDEYAARRWVCAWIAVGDVAFSPFLAFGGLAVAPVAVGAITVGVLSLSVFWGVAIGVFALGSLAFGWWAVGCAAAAWECAVGFAVVARSYAVGLVASAAEANNDVAKDWIRSQWFADFSELIVGHAQWWLLGCAALALAMGWWRKRSEPLHARSA